MLAKAGKSIKSEVGMMNAELLVTSRWWWPQALQFVILANAGETAVGRRR